jgi:HK97 family phage prohead protease
MESVTKHVGADAQRAAFPVKLDALDPEERSYTALFPYNVPDFLKRIFVPGVFRDFLAAPSWQVQHLWVHNDWALPLGPVLGLEETDAGLLFKAQFSDTVLGRDAWQLVQDGALSAVSISWIPVQTERQERGGATFTLQQKAKLLDVSPVNFGGMPGAKILRDRMVGHFDPEALLSDHPSTCCPHGPCDTAPLPYDLPIKVVGSLLKSHLEAPDATGAPSDPLEGACPCTPAQRRARQQLRLLALRTRAGG